MPKREPQEPYDDLGEIAHLDWYPTDPQTLGAMSDMSVIDAVKQAEREANQGSWFSRHPRAARIGLLISIIAQPVAGEVFLGGHWEAQTHSDELHRAAAFQRCEAVAKKRDTFGYLATMVHLSTLSEQQQKDCGYQYASYYVSTDAQVVATPEGVGGEIITPAVDPLVKLPPLSKLEEAYNRAVSRSTQTQYVERMLGTVSGILSDMLVLSALGWLVQRRQKKVAEEASA